MKIEQRELGAQLHTTGVREGTAEEVARAVPKFQERSFEGFFAEYGPVGNDLVVHFYLPKHLRIEGLGTREQQLWSSWWSEHFPAALSEVAQEHFKAEYPRVVAAYTEEVASWWFCARGFATSFDPKKLLDSFLEKLSVRLSTAQS